MKRTPLEGWVLARAGARDVDGLRAYQLRALRATVACVRERSPLYAERLRDVEPGEIRSLDDLARLPFTTGDDLRRHGGRLLCVPPHEVERIVTLQTSGTTGVPKRVQFSAADQELTLDFFHHGMSVLVRPGQRVLVLLPGERPGSVGELLARALTRMDVEGVVHGPVADPDEALRVLRAGRFDGVVGIPVQVVGLARRDAAGRTDAATPGDAAARRDAAARGGAATARPVTLESVLLSTDQAAPSLVAAIEEVWGCRVFDHYGTTEMGLGGGVECEARDGYHLREADLLFEVVDPESGAPVPDGEYGEVVFTTLTREAMPLVRYRTGDRGRFLTGPCPCGTRLRRLERVRARLGGRAALRVGGPKGVGGPKRAGGSPGAGGTTGAGRPAGTGGAAEVGRMIDQATLDEALFALPSVLDVRARLRRAPGADELDVEVLVLGGGADGAAAGLREQATAALTASSELAPALLAGRLRLHVTVTTDPWPQGVGTVKRTLVESGHTPEAIA